MDITLRLDKLFLGPFMETNSSRTPSKDRNLVVIVSTGSFNPPTYMHMRMFGRCTLVRLASTDLTWAIISTALLDVASVLLIHAIGFYQLSSLSIIELARDALNVSGYHVLGGYMSPTNDAYNKKGLLPAVHRVKMCELLCESSSFVMVDPWEAVQSSYQRTLTILSRIQSGLCNDGLVKQDSLKVMLLCGSDLLESFSIPGAWIRDQVRTICRDFGVICVRREGKDVEQIISNDEILQENKDNVIAVDEIIPNQISSTKIRL